MVDVNGQKQTGFTYSHGTLRDGLRCSASKAFLRPCSQRTNLHISTHSHAERILIGENSKMAYGVKFRKGSNALYTVYANCEVIIAAGAVQSPQLLMLSGIGPSQHLRDIGIGLVHDLPGVGRNLQDHVGMGGLCYLIDRPWWYNGDREFSFVLPKSLTYNSIREFANDADGPLYMIPECEAMAFVNTRYVYTLYLFNLI